MFDQLKIEPFRHIWNSISFDANLVVAFLEISLGYKISFMDGSTWILRRETELKTR
jgi:hypothetical protein